jgi:hypothetical protein
MPQPPHASAGHLDDLARLGAGEGRRPARFAERGVSLPFTTPFLLGGRMRRAERGGAELVLAHPAGAEGVYLLPWSAVPSLCAPTLHDRALWEHASAALPELTPSAARQAARTVAEAGYAGRDAARAATAAEAARREAPTANHYRLLLDLLRRIEPTDSAVAVAGPPPPAPTPDTLAGAERRVRSALGRLRQEGGPPPTVAMAALGEIAGALEGGGLPAGDGARRARLPRLVAGLADMAAEMDEAAAQAPDDARRAGLRLIAESAGLALRCARATLDAAHALLDDPWSLLRRWPGEGGNVLDRLSRPEWVLDGWDAIRALWRSRDVEDGTILHDMALLVPGMPAEVAAWTGFDVTGRTDALREGLRLWRRAAAPAAGRLAELTARNERLRALCA